MTTSKSILLDYKDIPEWVQAEIGNVRPRSKPRLRLHVVDDGMVSVTGPAYDYSCRHLIARNGAGNYMRMASGYYEAYLNMTAAERAVYHGGKIPIPDDGAVLSVDTHAKVPDLYVTPNHPLASLARRLPAGEQELDEIDRMILEIYVAYTSSGRKYEFSSNRIPKWLSSLYTLILEDMELLKINKIGAVRVTTKGRNVRSSTKCPWRWYTFGHDEELRARIISKARERLNAYDFSSIND